jgi:hypothetical protein
MASFAKLDINNIVINVIAVNNNELLDNGVESEEKGIIFLKSLYGQDTIWKQTSYNTQGGKYYTQVDRKFVYDPALQYKEFRKNFAGIGFTYNPSLDGFIPPKLYQSWTLDTETCTWIPPIDKPRPADNWIWDESIENWKEISLGSSEPIIE